MQDVKEKPPPGAQLRRARRWGVSTTEKVKEFDYGEAQEQKVTLAVARALRRADDATVRYVFSISQDKLQQIRLKTAHLSNAELGLPSLEGGEQCS